MCGLIEWKIFELVRYRLISRRFLETDPVYSFCSNINIDKWSNCFMNDKRFI